MSDEHGQPETEAENEAPLAYQDYQTSHPLGAIQAQGATIAANVGPLADIEATKGVDGNLVHVADVLDLTVTHPTGHVVRGSFANGDALLVLKPGEASLLDVVLSAFAAQASASDEAAAGSLLERVRDFLR